MKKEKLKLKKDSIQNDVNINLNPNDSLNPIKEDRNEQPEIYKIFKRGKSINRKDFIKNSAVLGGLAALGNLLQNCKESELDIETNGKNCTCHVVCTCNSEQETEYTGDNKKTGDQYVSYYDINQNCSCDTVCTCNSVCSCNTVCNCDSHGDSGGGTYWYPN